MLKYQLLFHFNEYFITFRKALLENSPLAWINVEVCVRKPDTYVKSICERQ